MNTQNIIRRSARAIRKLGTLGTFNDVPQTTCAVSGNITGSLVTQSVSYVEAEFSKQQLDSGLVRPTDKRIYIGADKISNVTIEDTVAIGSGTFNIEKADITTLKGTNVLYDLHLRLAFTNQRAFIYAYSESGSNDGLINSVYNMVKNTGSADLAWCGRVTDMSGHQATVATRAEEQLDSIIVFPYGTPVPIKGVVVIDGVIRKILAVLPRPSLGEISVEAKFWDVSATDVVLVP